MRLIATASVALCAACSVAPAPADPCDGWSELNFDQKLKLSDDAILLALSTVDSMIADVESPGPGSRAIRDRATSCYESRREAFVESLDRYCSSPRERRAGSIEDAGGSPFHDCAESVVRWRAERSPKDGSRRITSP